MKLGNEGLKYKEKADSIRLLNHVLALLHQYFTSPYFEADEQKRRKKLKSEQVPTDLLMESLTLVRNLLRGGTYDHITTKICVDVLVRIF